MSDNLSDLRGINLPFNIDEVVPQCHECIRKQLEKYKNAVDADGKAVVGRFLVPCKGIKKDILDSSLKNILTNEQIEQAEAAADIVAFAKKFLKLPNGEFWNARWYQQEVLRCLSGEQMVFMADGTVKQMDQIKVGDKVLSYNEIRRETSTCEVINVFEQGIKDVYRITLKNGDTLECTDNHPILSHYKGGKINKLYNVPSYKTGYQTIKDGLAAGSKVYVLNKFDRYGQNNNEDLAKILGYLVTDGWVSKRNCNNINSVSFANTNKLYADEFFDLLVKTFPESNPRRHYKESKIGKDNINRKPVYIISVYGIDNQFIKFLTKTVQCSSKYDKEITILKYAFTFSKEALVCFINRCWSGDGSVYSNNKSASLRLSSGNYEYLKLYRLLLKKIGVYSSNIYKDRPDKKAKGISLDIHRAIDIKCFFDNVKYVYGKEEQSIKAINKIEQMLLPRMSSLEPVKEEVVMGASLKGKLRTSARVKIKKVEYLGKKQTYDIEVDRRHNFIAQGLIVHNCSSTRKCLRISRRSGKTDLVCVEICYYLFTRKNMKILVAGPQKSQTEEIINRVRAFIASNPALQRSVTRDVSAPYYQIELQNGSRLRGFAAGADGGSKGIGIRGQDADRVYLEEMDFIDEQAITGAIFPLLQTSPNTALIGFSTPSGFETTYKGLCLKNPYYKEFHYNYKVLPWWKNIELERNQYSEEDFNHEFCFSGEQEITTYNNSIKTIKKIKDILIGDIVYSNKDKKLVEIINTFNNGIKKTFKYSTVINSVVCTDDHKFPNKNGCKEPIKNLKQLPFPYVKDYVYTTSNKDEIYARLIGYLNGDGNIVYRKNKSYEVRFYGPKEDMETIAHDLKTIYGKTFVPYFKSKANKETWCVCTSIYDIVKDLIDRGGLVGKKVQQINKIPDWIINHKNKKVRLEFLGGLFGAECSCPKPSGYVARSIVLNMTLKEDTLLYQLKDILEENQIDCSISKNILYIKDNSSIVNFLRLNPFRYSHYKEISTHKISTYFYYRDYLYKKYFDTYRDIIDKHNDTGETYVSLCSRYKIDYKALNKWKKRNTNNLSYRKFNNKFIKIQKCSDWLSSNVVADTPFLDIVSVEQNSEEEVFNITVNSSDHSYVLANGIETFNCAEFGETESGVYKPSYITRSLVQYEYKDMSPQNNWRYCIGADWNEKYGAEIVVLGYNNFTKMFQVVAAHHVERSEFTQLSSVQKLLEMNRRWKPSFIYIDSGNGSTNFELMRKTSYDARMRGSDPDTARLLDILKKYDSGASLETSDPVTHEKRKVPAKPFMVNASIRMFEQNMIRLSLYDKKLEEQLRNYIVVRETPTKTPVYGLKEEKILDHRLDALNLAIVAFQLEFGDLHKKNYATNAGAAADPRTIERSIKEEKFGKPEDRKLDGAIEKNWIEKQLFSSIPARLKSPTDGIKTNRLGWATDEEEKERARWMQRRRSRNVSNRRGDRPKRTNI